MKTIVHEGIKPHNQTWLEKCKRQEHLEEVGKGDYSGRECVEVITWPLSVSQGNTRRCPLLHIGVLAIIIKQ